jgi:hypothetical protein
MMQGLFVERFETGVRIQNPKYITPQGHRGRKEKQKNELQLKKQSIFCFLQSLRTLRLRGGKQFLIC